MAAKTYKARKEAGLCIDCASPNPDAGTFVTCPVCRARRAAQDRHKRATGICVGCSKPTEGRRVRCDRCQEKYLETQRGYRRKRKEEGLCACGRPREDGLRDCRGCRTGMRKCQTEWRRRRFEAGLCKCGQPIVPGTKHCEACLQGFRDKHRALKAEVFAAYGGFLCKCCGETIPEFLEMDHIDGDGAAHRLVVPPHKLYHWLKQQGYPAGFQVLCITCNVAKGRHGICPHQWPQYADRPRPPANG